VLEKHFRGPGKVLEFFVTKRVGTLNIESIFSLSQSVSQQLITA